MYNSLYEIFIVINILYYSYSWSSRPSHCLIYRRHDQPSVGHHLLHIEHSIDNEKLCEHKCSINHLCSMATYNRRHHRCHLFKHHRKHSLFHPYRTNYGFSTFANCQGSFSLSHIGKTHISIVHCDYDSYDIA